MILTYFPEYFSTCPTGIVYTRGTQSHHCRKRASCSYVISVEVSAPSIDGSPIISFVANSSASYKPSGVISTSVYSCWGLSSGSNPIAWRSSISTLNYSDVYTRNDSVITPLSLTNTFLIRY